MKSHLAYCWALGILFGYGQTVFAIPASYDQRQTGDINVQIHLKDVQVVALVDSELLEQYTDYDYAYDYADFTLKPIIKPTTSSPSVSTSSVKPWPTKPSSFTTTSKLTTKSEPPEPTTSSTTKNEPDEIATITSTTKNEPLEAATITSTAKNEPQETATISTTKNQSQVSVTTPTTRNELEEAATISTTKNEPEEVATKSPTIQNKIQSTNDSGNNFIGNEKSKADERPKDEESLCDKTKDSPTSIVQENSNQAVQEEIVTRNSKKRCSSGHALDKRGVCRKLQARRRIVLLPLAPRFGDKGHFAARKAFIKLAKTDSTQ